MNGDRYWWIVTGLFAFFVAVLVFAGCIHRGPKPDYREGRIEMYWNGQPSYPAREVEVIEAVIATHGAALCKDPQAFWRVWCASVSWQPLPFRCETAGPGDNRVFNGCQLVEHQCLFQVGHTDRIEDSALIDEQLHYAWEVCKGYSGEVNGIPTPDFAAEVAATRAQASEWLRSIR